MAGKPHELCIRPARPGEAPLVFRFVRELAEYEKLSHTVDALARLAERT